MVGSVPNRPRKTGVSWSPHPDFGDPIDKAKVNMIQYIQIKN